MVDENKECKYEIFDRNKGRYICPGREAAHKLNEVITFGDIYGRGEQIFLTAYCHNSNGKECPIRMFFNRHPRAQKMIEVKKL